MPRNHAVCLTMTINVRAKLFQSQQTELTVEIPDPQLGVVVVVLSFKPTAARPHAKPRIQFLEAPTTRRKAGRKVIRRTPDDSVQIPNDRTIQVVLADGQFPHLGLESLHGPSRHTPRTRRQHEPQESITFPKGRDLRLLGIE